MPINRLLLLTALLLAQNAFAIETLNGNFRYIWASQGTVAVGGGTGCNSTSSVCVYAEAVNSAASTTVVTVKFCWATTYSLSVTVTDPLWSSGNCVTTNSRQANVSTLAVVACPSGCSGVQYAMPAPGASVGTLQPSDGVNYYYLYGKIQSNVSSPANDVMINGSPMSYKYATVNGFPGYAQPWKPNTVTARLTPLQFVGVGNVLDTYSVGQSSGGTVVCAVSWGHQSGTVYNNGALGYWMQQHSVPCDSSHVFLASLTVTGTLTLPNTAMTNLLADIAATTGQAIAIGWAQPSVVQSGGSQASMSAYMTVGGFPTLSTFSTYFHSASSSPRTDYGYRPSMLLAAGHCVTNCSGDANNPSYLSTWAEQFSAFATVVDAAVAAKDTNPLTGRATAIYTSDNKRTQAMVGFMQSSLGAPSPINARLAASTITGSVSSPTSTNTAATCTTAILCQTASPHYSFSSSAQTPFLAGAGIGINVTSSGGDIPNDTAGGQDTALGWIAHGAVAAYGSATEPGQVPLTFPDIPELLSNYLQGSTVVEALWKSVRQPWYGNMIGDPLASPFTLPVTTTTTGNTFRGITLRGVTIPQ